MTTNHMTIKEIMTKPEYLAFERALMREYGNNAPADSLRHEYRLHDGPKPCGSGNLYIPRPEDCRPVDSRELQRLEGQLRR